MKKDIFRNIKAAIFDLDGTLVDSMWIWSNLLPTYFKQNSIKSDLTIEKIVEKMNIQQGAAYIDTLFHLNKGAQQILREWNEIIIHAHKTKVTLKKGTVELLNHLKKRHIKACVATESGGDIVEIALRERGIFHHFEFLISTCDMGKSKSCGDIYEVAAKKLNTPKGEIIVFEDALYAIETAKKSGFFVVAVHDNLFENNKDKIIKAADIYIKDFTGLIDE